MRGVAVVAFVTFLSSCGDPPRSRCTEGMSIACVCPDGRSGAQSCTAAGAFAPCECAGGADVGIAIDGSQPISDSGTDAWGTDSAGIDAAGIDSGPLIGTDAPPSGGHVISIPRDSARVLISDGTTGDLYPPTAFTYEFWINFDRIVPTLSQLIVNAQGGAASGLLGIWITDRDVLECVVRADGGHDPRAQITNASTVVTAGAWHHFACTGSDTGRVTLFMDGVEAGTDDATGPYRLPAPGQVLALGADTATVPSTTWRFNGLIDEFRVSSRQMYFGTFTPSRRLSLEPSTVALYHFDEGIGTSAMDAVGPGRHTATLDLGATWASE